MKGIGRRVSVLAICAVFATSLLGAAYTLWYEDLKLNVDVTTGTLDGAIGCGALGDNEMASWLGFGQPFSSYPKAVPLKDVAHGNPDIIPPLDPSGFDQPFTSEQGVDDNTWQLTVHNTYPGYMMDCELHVFNTGTVPWHLEVESIMITGPNGDVLNVDCTGVGSPTANCAAGNLGIGTNSPSWSPIYVQWKDFEGCQVHAGEELNSSFFVGVNQSALEGSDYNIMLKIRVHQWNESQWAGCGTLRPS